jgi:hypothetical protein
MSMPKVTWAAGWLAVVVSIVLLFLPNRQALAQFLIVPGNNSCVVDDFSGPDLDPTWTWIDPLGDSQYSLSANPGYVRLQAPDGDHDLATFNKNSPRLMRTLVGDFDIQTRLVVYPTQTYQSAGLFMWVDSDNFIWIGRSAYDVIAHNYVRDNSNAGLNPPEALYSDASVYFRITRSGNTFSTYYSATGVYWILTGSIEYPAPGDTVDAGLFLINNWQDNPFYADFDYFNSNCVSSNRLVFLPSVLKPVKPAIIEKNVFAIAYLDTDPFNDPDMHQRQLIADLRRASIWHGFSNPEGTSSLGYTTYGGKVLRLYEAPPHREDNGQFDYAAVYARFDLCVKIQQGLVDEVWIWESGTGNAWEWVTNGPNWSWTWGSNVPNCGKTVTTLNYNYQREIDVAFESFTHRLEGAFMTHYPCDFYTDTWPWINWPNRCQGLVSDHYGFVARPFSGNDFVGVCGDSHHPPNILDSREYIYNDSTYANSICEDWQWDGTSQVKNINCMEWECTHRGFHIWWMQNLPGYGNNNRDRNGNLMPDWWESLFW